ECCLQGVQCRGIRQARRDRVRSLQTIRGANHAGISPELRVVSIARVENSDDCPGLVVERQSRAYIESRELLLCILAGNQLSQSSLELPAGSDCDFGSEIPGLLPYSAHANESIESGGSFRQGSND